MQWFPKCLCCLPLMINENRWIFKGTNKLLLQWYSFIVKEHSLRGRTAVCFFSLVCCARIIVYLLNLKHHCGKHKNCNLITFFSMISDKFAAHIKYFVVTDNFRFNHFHIKIHQITSKILGSAFEVTPFGNNWCYFISHTLR